MEHEPGKRRIRPLDAWRAIRVLLQNPDDTGQVFRIIDALSGNSGERIFQRFRRDPVGARILRERRALLDTLSDRAALEALPVGTLGRTYADFVNREQITADGLVEASMEEPNRPDNGPERRLFGERLRDMHDLWHVVTGYGRDLVGEAALLAFSFNQTRNPGVGFIVAVAWFKAGRGEARRLIVDGFRRGGRAAWLPAQDWEALLAQPLDEVRRQLRIEPAPAYEPLRSAGAPPVEFEADAAQAQ
jgi:ubiquinone biosynthesis protein COQ4